MNLLLEHVTTLANPAQYAYATMILVMTRIDLTVNIGRK